jgi:hypothetical protein
LFWSITHLWSYCCWTFCLLYLWNFCTVSSFIVSLSLAWVKSHNSWLLVTQWVITIWFKTDIKYLLDWLRRHPGSH